MGCDFSNYSHQSSNDLLFKLVTGVWVECVFQCLHWEMIALPVLPAILHRVKHQDIHSLQNVVDPQA